MPMPQNAKSILQTQDPYHTPGYGGYCPQFKYRIGQTFGKTTHDLLTDRDVATSGRLLLTNIYPHETEMDVINRGRTQLINTRTASWGDQKLVDKMVPGYTGFVPRGEHYFGKRYAENCFNAISDFENEQRKRNLYLNSVKEAGALQDGKMDYNQGRSEMTSLQTRTKMPLRRIAPDAAKYNSPQLVPLHEYSKSPYKMGNNENRKCFMSGYTGFVPRARGLQGKGYPIITHEALNTFTDNFKKYTEGQRKPVQIIRHDPVVVDTNHIYPLHSGVVPNYTGHIPGQKFRFGRTFGHSTIDAVNHSGFSKEFMPAVGNWQKGTTVLPESATAPMHTLATSSMQTNTQRTAQPMVA